MKIKLSTIIALILFSALCTPMFAVHKAPIKANTEVSTVDAKKAEKLEKKLNKLGAKLEKKLAKKQAKVGESDVDFESEPDRWMWFWIFGWGGAILLSIIAAIIGSGILGALAGLLGLAGTVALIIWIVKKFS